MKILFYIESLHAGGKERRLIELIKGLKKEYLDIEMELVLTKEEIHYKEIFKTGIKIHYTIRKGLKKDPRLFWKFYKIAKQFKPDIIHVWGNMVAIYAIPAKVLLGVPMINNQITDAPLSVKGGPLSHKLSFTFSDKIIANSYAGLRAYKAPSNKSLVIYNGFDFNRIKNLSTKKSIREKFNISTPFVVGMVASFSGKKDYKTFINAAILVLEKRNDVTFLCIGSGDDTQYRHMVSDVNKNKILFLGPQKNVENIMNICDIGVLASFTEGISNSLMEFMALGKPVVASGDGGLNELVKDNFNGYLIESANPELLFEKIKSLLMDEQKRILMGQKSKEIVLERFNIDKMIDRFYFEYKNI
jgi:glycosyltransferase involved in cell wall biosynthesis